MGDELVQGGTLDHRGELQPCWSALLGGGLSLIAAGDTRGHCCLIARIAGIEDRHRRWTARELEVARRVADGQSNKLIAYELGISPTTVAGHVARVARRLAVASRVQLIGRWVRVEALARAERTGCVEVADVWADGKRYRRMRFPAMRSPLPDALTDSEREVLQAALAGGRDQDIARARARSAATVRKQLQSAFRKLGVGSRGELAALLPARVA